MCEESTPQDKTQKAGNGLRYFYTILQTYRGFDEVLNLECQSKLLHDTFERYWDFYGMVIDYYAKYPDPELKMSEGCGRRQWRGEAATEEEADERSDDGDNE